MAFVVNAGVIGDQTQPQALELGEAVALQHVDAIEHRGNLVLRAHHNGGRAADLQGLGGEGADAGKQIAHITFAIRVQAGAEEDIEAFRAWIDPQRRAGETRVPKGTQREALAAWPTELAVDVPAQTATFIHSGRCLRRGDELQGFGVEQPHALQFARQHQPRIAGQVGSGGEESGMTRHTAHPAGRGIVHHATQHHALLIAFRRCDARQQSGFRIEAGVQHLQRPKDMRFRKHIEGLAAHAPHHLAQQQEVHIAVAKHMPGSGIRHAGTGEADAFIVARPHRL